MGHLSDTSFIKNYNHIATILKSHNFILTDYQKAGIKWMFERETLHNCLYVNYMLKKAECDSFSFKKKTNS